MFGPLGFTIIFCMVASLISAMTIVPLCYCTYRPREKENTPVGKILTAMQNGYRNLMKVLLQHKAAVIITSVVMLAVSIFLATQLRMEMMVSDEDGEIAITIETRPGLTVEETDKILTQVEAIVAADPDLDSYLLTSGGSGYSISGSDSATLTAYLNDNMKKKTQTVIDRWKPEMNKIAGASISMEASSSTSSSSISSSDGLNVVLWSTEYDELKSVSDDIVKELTDRSDVINVHSDLENSAPVVKVNVDSMKANAENITPLQVYSAVSNTLQGIDATTLKVNGDEVDVTVEYPKEMYDTIDELQGIVLKNNAGGSVALTDVADIVYKDSPSMIRRYNKQYQATITGDYLTSDKREKDEMDNLLKKEVVQKHLTQNVELGTDTVTEMMNKEFSKLFGAIATAVFLVFVVMAAQFESPKFSLMVMTTIPFALIGSFTFLWVPDVPISMASLLGFLMLSGTVVNNGILYVDTVNQYRAEMDLETALIEAGATRLRPILMTTLTTIVAMIPMALAYGDSGKSMQGLALVDVGGLVASTILALLMLPVYYAIMTPKHKKQVSYD
jgi:multidrug efflux pump subunit AcrB